MAISVHKLDIDCKTTVLSSRSAVYKTAELAAKLHRLNKSDFALGKIYEAVLALRAGSVATLSDGNGFYTASFGQHGEYEFSFATGALPAPLKRDDIIFYDFTGEGSEDLRLNDRRLETYLKDRSVFAAVLTPARTRPSGAAYRRGQRQDQPLYRQNSFRGGARLRGKSALLHLFSRTSRRHPTQSERLCRGYRKFRRRIHARQSAFHRSRPQKSRGKQTRHIF